MSRESLGTFALPEPPEGRPSLGERIRPVLVLVSAAAVAAAVAAWLVGHRPPASSPGRTDALTELVQRSRREAAPVASELLASLRESAPAASKTSPLGPGPIRSKLARAAEEASAAVRPTASLGAELSPPPPDAAELQSGYHIQVASLRVKETADELAASLRKQGFRARSDPYGFSKADWWHVVRIGPFQTRVAAEGRRLQLGPVQRATAVVLPRARGKHHVQIASLQSNEQAIQLLERLQQRGHSARITTVGETGQGRWHCVRIGPFDSRQEAEDYRALLKAREDIDSQVVPFAPSE